MLRVGLALGLLMMATTSSADAPRRPKRGIASGSSPTTIPVAWGRPAQIGATGALGQRWLGRSDPLDQPPDTHDIPGTDTSARPLILKDNGGVGDLFAILPSDNATVTWYMIRSQDNGASWAYVTGTGSAPAYGAADVNDISIAQDTVNGKVHIVVYMHGDTNVHYHRVALTRSSGHISSWAWETVDQIGPAFDCTAANNNFNSAKMYLREVIDGNGAHILMLMGIDQPTATRIRRLVAARTVAGANALAPTGAGQWVNFVTGGAGFTVIGAWNTDTGVDGAALLNLTSQTNPPSIHESDFTFAQLRTDNSIHAFIGNMYYNDQRRTGDLRRWRFTANGANWSLDANGTVIAAADGTASPTIGNSVATANYVWLTWGETGGLHFSRIDTSGTWTTNAVSSPDTTAQQWWNSAMSVNADESTVYAQWEKWDQSNALIGEYAGVYRGGWTTNTDTSLWLGASWNGSSVWSPIVTPTGLGVLAYAYIDWSLATQHWHIHTADWAQVTGTGDGVSSTLAAQAGTGTLGTVTGGGGAGNGSATIVKVTGAGAQAGLAAGGGGAAAALAGTGTLVALAGGGGGAPTAVAGTGSPAALAAGGGGAPAAVTAAGAVVASYAGGGGVPVAQAGTGTLGTVTGSGGGGSGTATLSAVAGTGSPANAVAGGGGALAGVVGVGALAALGAGGGAALAAQAGAGTLQAAAAGGGAALSASSASGALAASYAGGGGTLSQRTATGASGAASSSGGASATLTQVVAVGSLVPVYGGVPPAGGVNSGLMGFFPEG